MVFKKLLLLIVVPMLLSGCFKKNIMFQTDTPLGDSLLFAASKLDKSYIINPNDYLDVQVFTNNGERLIDPNFAMPSGAGIGAAGANASVQSQLQPVIKYLVQYDGFIDLPLIGRVKIEGYDLHQTDSCLAKEYGKFYKGAFVYTRLLNKRVYVFGSLMNIGTTSLATSGKVVPLENENMNLIEVIAIAGGIDYYSKVHNIRLIRGNLKNPSVQIINLHTIEGMRKASLSVQPNDIVYIEKYNRRFSQSLTEVTPAISLVTSALTLIVLIATLKK